MPVGFSPCSDDDLLPVAGVRLGVAQAGIRYANRYDLTVIALDEGSSVGAVFTKNRFCAAPVQVAQAHLAGQAGIRALVINTGNANAGTGEIGLEHARSSCEALAEHLKISSQSVLPFSTGVIMEMLPCDRLIAGLPAALADLKPAGWGAAARAIMTTDTVHKAHSRQVKLGDTVVTITGMSKGAGMICPNMATMLAFIATDAQIAPELMKPLAKRLADESFHRITVDGDTSTNDSFVVMATHQAQHPVIRDWKSEEAQALYAALKEVVQFLAQAIIRDAEGATKFITIEVQAGQTQVECEQVARAIAHSPLVKTALFASDPNLGRILAAVGYAGIESLDPSTIDLYLNGVHVATRGERHPDYTESAGQAAMKPSEITIRVSLGRGTQSYMLWTSDLSEEYVRVNADYRS